MVVSNVVILTGAGISAESGIPTFRDAGGLWEGFDIYEVATPEGFRKNPELVLDFYNQRRKAVRNAQPNEAHKALVKLERNYHVTVITQNIDDLHERAGSKRVIHLHGEILKAKSSRYPELIYPLGEKDIKMGDLCEKGYQLRPHVVWFGESVPMMENATTAVSTADFLIVIGTSLAVYPAANLIHYTKDTCMKFIIDPKIPEIITDEMTGKIEKTAVEGVPEVVDILLDLANIHM